MLSWSPTLSKGTVTDRPKTIEDATRRIAELSQQLRAVTAERDEYRLAFDRAPLLIWYKDDKNTVLRANEPAAASAGLTPDQVVGRSTFDLYPEEADGYYRDDLEVIRSGRPKLGIIERLETPEGKRWVQTDKIPWRSPSGEAAGVLVFVRDITDRIQMQEELYRAQRLESLGLLAGGIAHDFNNLLQSIYGNVELLRLRLEVPEQGEGSATEDPAARYVRRAMSSIARARSLTQQLLTFAKGGQPGRSPVPLEPLIEEVVTLALSGSSIQPDVIVQPDLDPCLGDRSQIAQLVENLLVNAVQAIEQAESRSQPGARRAPGVCRVRVRRRSDPLPTYTGSWIEVEIADNGEGIEPGHLERIFDPFFTTKAEGSGLGLASAYRSPSVMAARSTAGTTAAAAPRSACCSPLRRRPPEISPPGRTRSCRASRPCASCCSTTTRPSGSSRSLPGHTWGWSCDASVTSPRRFDPASVRSRAAERTTWPSSTSRCVVGSVAPTH